MHLILVSQEGIGGGTAIIEFPRTGNKAFIGLFRFSTEHIGHYLVPEAYAKHRDTG